VSSSVDANKAVKLAVDALEPKGAATSKGKKFDGKKPRVDLIPPEFTIGTADALTFGGKKYGEHNFKEGIQYSRLLGAAKRHIELELANVGVDGDSKLDHWKLACASLAMYAFMVRNRSAMDDRFQYTDEEKKALVDMMYGEGE